MLPRLLREWMEAGGRRVTGAAPLSGGMISAAARVETDNGPLFLKWRTDGGSGDIFVAEAEGLRALAETGAIRVPEVRGWNADTAGGVPPCLLLEYIPPREPVGQAAFVERFAQALAALHHAKSAESAFGYGFAGHNFIGLLPQPNLPRSIRWAEFYRECRLLPQIHIARDNGRLTAESERPLMQVVEKLDDLLAGLPEEVSLLHGDLWSGNFLCTSGDEPALIDPAAYYGHREMELAYIELFGGFPPGFVRAYYEAYPLDAGYPRRRALHQLYHLINHWNHFGEPYGARVAEVCRAYLL